LPIVLTQHGIETQVGWTAPLCRWTSRFVHATVATSRRVRDALGRDDVVVIPCGVDDALFQPVPQAEARAVLGLPAEGPIVLFAGMRRPEKRVDLIEAAVRRVQGELSGVALLIAERVPHEEMPLYMNAADVLVLASEAEGSPMVVKEALACNLPVVSVDVGDVAELVRDAPGCQIVERSVDGLASGLLTALRRGARTDGRKVAAQVSLQAVAERLDGLFEDVLSTRPHEHPSVQFSSNVQTISRESATPRDSRAGDLGPRDGV
jgi:glycosyltransferase involved in cell wall biosynthesis